MHTQDWAIVLTQLSIENQMQLRFLCYLIRCADYSVSDAWDEDQAEMNTANFIFLWLLASKFPRKYDNHFHIWLLPFETSVS